MKASPWSPIAFMWLVMGVVAAVSVDYLSAWLALACVGLSILSAILDRINRREARLLHSSNRILAARVRLYEKETVERRRQ